MIVSEKALRQDDFTGRGFKPRNVMEKPVIPVTVFPKNGGDAMSVVPFQLPGRVGRNGAYEFPYRGCERPYRDAIPFREPERGFARPGVPQQLDQSDNVSPCFPGREVGSPCRT